MSATAALRPTALSVERSAFVPPPQPGLLRGWALALLAHALLVGALALAVQWKRADDAPALVQAELWPDVPEPPQLKPPRATPQPQAQTQELLPDADIAVQQQEQERQRRQREDEQAHKLAAQKAQAEQAAAEKKASEQAAAKQAEQQAARQRQLEQDQAQQKQKEQAEKRAAEQKRQADQRAADAKKEREQKAAAAQQAKQLEAQRQENLKRMMGQAGATGPATVTAGQTSGAEGGGGGRGPSAGYAGRIAALVKRNIVFTEDAAGNPVAEVRVNCAPDGTIISRTLTRRSGNPAWDEAVLRAIDKTEVLPRDVDGRVPASILMRFRPQD